MYEENSLVSFLLLQYIEYDTVKMIFQKGIGPYNMDDLAFDGQYKDTIIIELKQET